MKEIILSAMNLTKGYNNTLAINNLSFDVQKGQILGIIGPNGSGKTTTLNILLNLTTPESGKVELLHSPHSLNTLPSIGAALDFGGFFPELSGRENLKIKTIIKKESRDKIDELLELLGLEKQANKKYKNYSLGMQQRLAIANALIGNPEIIILDEPNNGLDPNGIIEVRQLVQHLNTQGKTIIIASHLLEEMQKICTDVLLLNKGKKIVQTPITSLILEFSSIENAYLKLTEK